MDTPTSTSESDAQSEPGAISSPLWHGLIGFIAGLALIFLPPLLASLAILGDHETDISLFSQGRVVTGVAVAAFIALITVIFEYKRPESPQRVFTRALAVPGLMLGSWQTLTSTTQLREAHREIHANQADAEKTAGIEVIDDATTTAPPPKPTSSRAVVSTVHYASLAPSAEAIRSLARLQLGAVIAERRYQVVLSVDADTLAAAQRRKEIQATCCARSYYSVRTEQKGGPWFLLESRETYPRTLALKRAIALKAKYPKLKLEPQLLAAPK
jgi:hypothetical protein